MRMSDVSGRKVMDVTAAEDIGSVVAPIIQGEPARLAGFRVKGDRPVLGWDDIRGVGADAVTVDGPDVIREASTDPESRATGIPIDPIGIRVLDEDGVELGTLDDIEFDPSTGAIEEFLVSGTTHRADRFLGIGDYALVLRAATPA